jgi:hypothetical protein
MSPEPFAKVVEWLDLQENIEGGLSFSVFCDSNLPQIVPPFRHPSESGDPEAGERGTGGGNPKETRNQPERSKSGFPRSRE